MSKKVQQLVHLTKIKGKGAGTAVTQITQKAYLGAKSRGRLKDWVLTSEIEDLEVVDVVDVVKKPTPTPTPTPEPSPSAEETPATDDTPSDVNDDEDFDAEIDGEDEPTAPFYTQEYFDDKDNEMTIPKIKEIIVSMADKGIGVPTGQVKKQVLIDLVIDNQ